MGIFSKGWDIATWPYHEAKKTAESAIDDAEAAEGSLVDSATASVVVVKGDETFAELENIYKTLPDFYTNDQPINFASKIEVDRTVGSAKIGIPIRSVNMRLKVAAAMRVQDKDRGLTVPPGEKPPDAYSGAKSSSSSISMEEIALIGGAGFLLFIFLVREA